MQPDGGTDLFYQKSFVAGKPWDGSTIIWFDRQFGAEQKARASLNLKLKWRPARARRPARGPLFPLEVADCNARLHALVYEGGREVVYTQISCRAGTNERGILRS